MMLSYTPLLAIWSALFLFTFAYTTPTSMCTDGCNPISKPSVQDAVPAGKPYTIKWQPTTSGTVTILLLHGSSSNMEKLYSIADKVSNSGTFEWTPSLELDADVTHYGLQLIDDSDGTYQYSTQFGISNSNPVAKASTSVASAKPSATSTKTKATSATHSVTSSSATTSQSTTSTATHSGPASTTLSTVTSQTAAATATAGAKTASASSTAATSGITKAWNTLGNGAKIGIVIAAVVVFLALVAILNVLIQLCRRRTHAVPVYTSLPGGGADTAYHR